MRLIGITGVLALPVQGLWTSLRKNIAGSPQKALRDPRRAASKSAAESCSSEEKKSILKRFKELEKNTSERREKLKKKVEMFLKDGDVGVLQDEVDVEKVEKEKAKEKENIGGGDKPVEQKGNEGEGEEEMTEDEKRGYERAMREMKLKEGGGGR
jgi:FtsZ-interacting cell division protein ZipA